MLPIGRPGPSVESGLPQGVGAGMGFARVHLRAASLAAVYAAWMGLPWIHALGHAAESPCLQCERSVEAPQLQARCDGDCGNPDHHHHHAAHDAHHCGICRTGSAPVAPATGGGFTPAEHACTGRWAAAISYAVTATYEGRFAPRAPPSSPV